MAVIEHVSLNLRSFLDMLAYSESTSTCRISQHDGYDVIVMGMDGLPEIFDDFSDHPFAGGRPSKLIRMKPRKLTSNASGRYQFMLKDWNHYRALLDLPDFGPLSQDKWAIRLIRERRALADIEAGHFASAVKKCRNIWASLPGAGYGQPENSYVKLEKAYINAGGNIA